MSKSFTLSKMSFKDIVIAVLVLYITYKLVESTGIEPVRYAFVIVNQMSADLLPKYKNEQFNDMLRSRRTDSLRTYPGRGLHSYIPDPT